MKIIENTRKKSVETPTFAQLRPPPQGIQLRLALAHQLPAEAVQAHAHQEPAGVPVTAS